MKVSEHTGIMLLATKRDGSPGTGAALRCDSLMGCGRFKVQFVASLGLRRIVPGLPESETVCVNGEKPCVCALPAKKWLDASKQVMR